jgi:hypothetical protein
VIEFSVAGPEAFMNSVKKDFFREAFKKNLLHRFGFLDENASRLKTLSLDFS